MRMVLFVLMIFILVSCDKPTDQKQSKKVDNKEKSTKSRGIIHVVTFGLATLSWTNTIIYKYRQYNLSQQENIVHDLPLYTPFYTSKKTIYLLFIIFTIIGITTCYYRIKNNNNSLLASGIMLSIFIPLLLMLCLRERREPTRSHKELPYIDIDLNFVIFNAFS